MSEHSFGEWIKEVIYGTLWDTDESQMTQKYKTCVATDNEKGMALI